MARRRGEVTEDLTFFSPRLNPQGEELNPAVGGKKLRHLRLQLQHFAREEMRNGDQGKVKY